MKHIKLLAVLVMFCGFYGNCVADTAPVAEPAAVDPTLVFFTSLSTCTPGEYTEQNDLTQQIGRPYLQQQIVGLEDNICSVILSTPDNRKMVCAFPMQQMTQIMDQHFLQGVLQNASNPDQNGVNAETTWSNLKSKYCIFNPTQ